MTTTNPIFPGDLPTNAELLLFPRSILNNSGANKNREGLNPLTSVEIAIEILDNRIIPQFHRTMLQIIRRNPGRRNDLVSDLMEFETSAEPPGPKYSALLIIEETLEPIGERIRHRRIYLQVDCDHGDVYISSNHPVILKGFAGVVEHALGLMNPSAGILKVITRSTRRSFSVEIRDIGNGIDHPTKHRSHEPYFAVKYGTQEFGFTTGIQTRLNTNAGADGKSLPGTASGVPLNFFGTN